MSKPLRLVLLISSLSHMIGGFPQLVRGTAPRASFNITRGWDLRLHHLNLDVVRTIPSNRGDNDWCIPTPPTYEEIKATCLKRWQLLADAIGVCPNSIDM
jgi:hypothetical protein